MVLTNRATNLILVSCTLSHVFVDGHVPYLERDDLTDSDPFVLDDPKKSTAIYGQLESSTDVDVFEFTITESPAVVFAEVIVPVCGDAFENFSPSIAIVGPGLPEPNCTVPITIPNGSGAICLSGGNGSSREIYSECFANKDYYEGPQYTADVNETGLYRFAVWDPINNMQGDYTAVFGPDEIWCVPDILRALIVTPLIRWFDVELSSDEC